MCDGNRTRVVRLQGRSSTIELHTPYLQVSEISRQARLADLFIFAHNPKAVNNNLDSFQQCCLNRSFYQCVVLSVLLLTKPIGRVLLGCMTTQAASAKPEKETIKASAPRTRSPGYPAFSLKDSIERAKVVWQHEKRNPAPPAALAADWGLNVKSSSTLLTVAALKKFGLLEDVDSGKERLLKLSEAALNIILNDQEDSPERIGLLKQCALMPVIHAELWEKYIGDLPSDTNLKRHLIMEKGFNAASVDNFIKQFRDTISFAKLSPSDKITVVKTSDSESNSEEKDTMKFGQQNAGPRNTGLGQPKVITAEDVAAKTYANISPMSVLREFTVPLSVGTIALRLPYPMEEDDFQLFLDTLRLWKKQLVKKTETKTAWPKPPFVAMWKNKHCDTMVEIVGEMGEKDGVKFYQSKDGTGIPAPELFPGVKPV